MGEKIDVVSPFCQGCTLKCTNGGRGCVAWQKWHIDWWNRNVYNPPDSTEEGAENESSDSPEKPFADAMAEQWGSLSPEAGGKDE